MIFARDLPHGGRRRIQWTAAGRFNETTGVDHDQVGLTTSYGVDELVVSSSFINVSASTCSSNNQDFPLYFFHVVLPDGMVYRVAG
jgi:hypothetical protein